MIILDQHDVTVIHNFDVVYDRWNVDVICTCIKNISTHSNSNKNYNKSSV
jgi:hypothetical protein